MNINKNMDYFIAKHGYYVCDNIRYLDHDAY